MSRKVIATLFPLFLISLLLVPNSINYVSAVSTNDVSEPQAKDIDVYVNGTYTSGSWMVFEIEQSGFTSIGDEYAEWRLLDSEGKTVYVWKHEPDEHTWNKYSGAWWAKDRFEIQLPCLLLKNAGSWTVDAQFKATVSDFNSQVIHFHINVKKGSLVDNLFAPIYVYNNPEVSGIKLGYIQFTLFPLGYIVAFILGIIFIVLMVRYIRSAIHEGGEIIKKSNERIKSSWHKNSGR